MAIYDHVYPFVAGAMHAMYLTSFLLIPLMLVEVFAPAQRLHWRTIGFNLVYAPVFLVLQSLVIHPTAAAVIPFIPENIFGGRPQEWPWWKAAVIVLAYLLSFDFCYYWLHRAQHHWPFLWRFHRFHHSDVSLAAASSFRHHWLEEFFRYFAIAIPLLCVFGPIQLAAPLLGLSMGAYGLFVHWNTRLELGPLTGVIVGPRYHRIHHSSAPEQINRNFATFFPILDKLFGTQYLPREGDHPITGINEVKRPNSILQLLPIPARDV